METLILSDDHIAYFDREFFQNQYDEGLLKDADCFALLFKLKKSSFKNVDMQKDEQDRITICKHLDIDLKTWSTLLKFLKLSDKNIEFSELEYELLILLSNIFGNIPTIDQFIIQKQMDKSKHYNPMTPKEDFKKLYHWSIDFCQPKDLSYSATISIPNCNNNKIYFRKLKI